MVAYNFKSRFIGPICVGLGREIPQIPNVRIPAGADIKPKRQTIRAHGKRRHARPGENLQLYYAQRTKQCTQLGISRCIASDPVELDLEHGRVLIRTEDGPIIHETDEMLDSFSQADGFSFWLDLVKFWDDEHPGINLFNGQLIRWEPIR